MSFSFLALRLFVVYSTVCVLVYAHPPCKKYGVAGGDDSHDCELPGAIAGKECDGETPRCTKHLFKKVGIPDCATYSRPTGTRPCDMLSGEKGVCYASTTCKPVIGCDLDTIGNVNCYARKDAPASTEKGCTLSKDDWAAKRTCAGATLRGKGRVDVVQGGRFCTQLLSTGVVLEEYYLCDTVAAAQSLPPPPTSAVPQWQWQWQWQWVIICAAGLCVVYGCCAFLAGNTCGFMIAIANKSSKAGQSQSSVV